MNKIHHMPVERDGITHKFTIGKQTGYITVGLLPDGTPGEIFLTLDPGNDGTIRGLAHTLAMVCSCALQYGMPLKDLVSKLENHRFEPQGLTKNKNIPMASSIPDYVAKWLRTRFLEAA